MLVSEGLRGTAVVGNAGDTGGANSERVALRNLRGRAHTDGVGVGGLQRVDLGLGLVAGAMDPGVGTDMVASIEQKIRFDGVWMIRPAGGRPEREVFCAEQVARIHLRSKAACGVGENNRGGSEFVELVDGGDHRVEVVAFVKMEASALKD